MENTSVITKKARPFFILLPIFLLALFGRLYLLESHFTHVDDIGVARTILEAQKKEYPDTNILRKVIHDMSNSKMYSTKEFKIYRFEEKLGLLEIAAPFNRFIFYNPHFKIMPNWSYPPIQFLFTPFLISEDLSYPKILFWGRMPSLIFSIMGMAVFVLFIRRLDQNDFLPRAILGVAILACSWENIIYSAQMSSYAAGIFSFFLLMLLLHYQLTNPDFKKKRVILFPALYMMLTMLSYQMLLFAPAIILTIFLHNRHVQKTPNNVVFRFCCLITIQYGLFVYLLREIKLRQIPTVFSWNSGPKEEFIFSFQLQQGLFNEIGRFLIFFYDNLYLLFSSMVSFLPENHIAYNSINGLFLLLAILGFIKLFFSNIVKKKFLGLFILIAIFTGSVFLFAGKITMSPTRHSLILLPIFVILISEGFASLTFMVLKLFRKPLETEKLMWRSSVMAATLIALLFASSYSDKVEERHDPFQSIQWSQFLDRYKVDALIQYDYTVNAFLMTDVLERMNRTFILPDTFILPGQTTMLAQLNQEENCVKTVAFISHRSPMNPDSFPEIMNQLRTAYGADPSQLVNFEQWKYLYKKEVVSDIEIESLNRTHNGTNSFYLYVLTNKECLVIKDTGYKRFKNI